MNGMRRVSRPTKAWMRCGIPFYVLAFLFLTGCSTTRAPGDSGCPAQTWEDVAEIISVSPVAPGGGTQLGSRETNPYLVEFRILGDTAPENSAVRRRTTPFLLTLGAGGLPDAGYLDRYGIVPGAKVRVVVTEGFPEERWLHCGGVRIRFVGTE